MNRIGLTVSSKELMKLWLELSDDKNANSINLNMLKHFFDKNKLTPTENQGLLQTGVNNPQKNNQEEANPRRNTYSGGFKVDNMTPTNSMPNTVSMQPQSNSSGLGNTSTGNDAIYLKLREKMEKLGTSAPIDLLRMFDLDRSGSVDKKVYL